jgi:hypothetical protein
LVHTNKQRAQSLEAFYHKLLRRKGVFHLRLSAFICGFGLLGRIFEVEASAPGIELL